METHTYDVLVIGSGAAGLRAAIEAGGKGFRVGVISKSAPGTASCTLLSGGAFAGAQADGDPAAHRSRTLIAGRGINQIDLVDVLMEESSSRLRELVSWGMRATLQEGHLYAEGRPSVWGEEIVRCLLNRARMVGVELTGSMIVFRIIATDDGAAVLAYSSVRAQWTVYTCKALVLAAGGGAALFLRHDNPQGILGDGYTLAFEAGTLLQDLEFVQFYPLGLAEPGCAAFLIPPRLADKGCMKNGRGENILAKYEIQERPAAERARDRLSQALFVEIYQGKEMVWLDLSRVSEQDWCCDPLSASTREKLGEHYGASKYPLRIAPLAHHVMGGVRIDPHGATTVPGLFAAGEVTGGLHGANRMGGNALTETVVFGARAGETAAAWVGGRTRLNQGVLFEQLRQHLPQKPSKLRNTKEGEIKRDLRKVLWENGGIIRTGESLIRAMAHVEQSRALTRCLLASTSGRELQRVIELHLGLRAAHLALRAALQRQESRGAHFRRDFPEQDDDRWQGHLQVRLSQESEELWGFEEADRLAMNRIRCHPNIG